MNHIVNFGLLFSFVTLAVSGILGFLRPFSTTTTRVHIVFGLVTLILVACHLLARLNYFKRSVSNRGSKPLGWLRLSGITTLWLGLLTIAIAGWTPAEALIRLGYEYRQRTAIVRNASLTGYEFSSDTLTLTRAPGANADVSVSLNVQFAQDLPRRPSLAIWAETSSGSMIETLYLNTALSYSETPDWNGIPTSRHKILPIWRHRHTLVSGVDIKGKVDAVSGATKSHQFTLDNYLVTGDDKSFVLCVEVNLPADPNEHFPDIHFGQASLLYTAYIEPEMKQKYVLLELTGHGGGAEENGAIQYDLERFTSALGIIDLLLAKVEYLPGSAQEP